MNYTELIGKYNGRNFMVVGTGSSLRKYGDKIKELIKDENIITIGINNVYDFIEPTYNIWTNNGRLKQYYKCISGNSIIFFGYGIKKENIKNLYKGKYYIVDYTDKKGIPIGYKNGKINGFYRTAGCLSIMLSHLMGAKKIYVAGMDGYTLNDKELIDNNKAGQHFYGKGLTDGTSWEMGEKKDIIVYNVLRSIKNYGVDFSIITPTVFKEFYNGF